MSAAKWVRIILVAVPLTVLFTAVLLLTRMPGGALTFVAGIAGVIFMGAHISALAS